MSLYTRKIDAVSAMPTGLERQKKMAEMGVVSELWDLGPKCYRDRSCLPPVISGLLYHFRLTKAPKPDPDDAKEAEDIREDINKIHHIVKCISFVLITLDGDLIKTWDPASLDLIKKLWVAFWQWAGSFIHMYCIRTHVSLPADVCPLPRGKNLDWAKPAWQVLKDTVRVTHTFQSINQEMKTFVGASGEVASRLLEAWVCILIGKNIPAAEIPLVEKFITDNMYGMEMKLEPHSAMDMRPYIPVALPHLFQRFVTISPESEQLTHAFHFLYRIAASSDVLRQVILTGKSTPAISYVVRRVLDAPLAVQSGLEYQTTVFTFLEYFAILVKQECKAGCEWISEALQYRLLYYVREISAKHIHIFPPERQMSILETILQITHRLQLALIFRPVLKECAKSFVPKIRFDAETGNAKAWRGTSAVRDKARETKKKLAAQDGWVYKTCANRRCPQQDSIVTRSCAGCGLVHFCSRQCQKIVWTESHKKQCLSFQTRRREGSLAFPASDRDLHVLRASVRLYLVEHPEAYVSTGLPLEVDYPSVVRMVYAPDPYPTPEVTWQVSVASSRQLVNQRPAGWRVSPPDLAGRGWRGVVDHAKANDGKGRLVHVTVPSAMEDITVLWFIEF